jgi:hypothetical protein
VITTSGAIAVKPVSATMARPRATATVAKATLAGGTNGAVILGGGAPPEAYNVAAQTFAPFGTQVTPGAGHTATALPSGKVLVLGGVDPAASPPAATDAGLLLDAAAMTATPLPKLLSSPRAGHTATLLGATLLVCGGVDAGGKAGKTCDLLDVGADPRLVKSIPLAAARTDHVAVLLPQGTVLIAGGRGDTGDVASVEIYTPQ